MATNDTKSLMIRDLGGGMNLDLPSVLVPTRNCLSSYNMLPYHQTCMRRRKGCYTASMLGPVSGEVFYIHPVDGIWFADKLFAGSVDVHLAEWAGDGDPHGAGLYVMVRNSDGRFEWQEIVDYRPARVGVNYNSLQNEPIDWDLSVYDDKLWASNGTPMPVLYDGEWRMWGLPEPMVKPKAIDSPCFRRCESRDEAEAESVNGVPYAWDAAKQTFVPLETLRQLGQAPIVNTDFRYARIFGGVKRNEYSYRVRCQTATHDGPLSQPSENIEPNGENVDVYDVAPRHGGIAVRAFQQDELNVTFDYGSGYLDREIYDWCFRREIRNIRFWGWAESTPTVDGKDYIAIYAPHQVHKMFVGQKVNLWKSQFNVADNTMYFTRHWSDNTPEFTVEYVDPEFGWIRLSATSLPPATWVQYGAASTINTASYAEGFLEYLVDPAVSMIRGSPMVLESIQGGYKHTNGVYYFDTDNFAFFYPNFPGMEDEARYELEFISGAPAYPSKQPKAYIAQSTFAITDPVHLMSAEEVAAGVPALYPNAFEVYYFDESGKPRAQDATIQNPTGADTDYPSMIFCPFAKAPLISVDRDIPDEQWNSGNIFLYKKYDTLNEDYLPNIKGAALGRASGLATADYHLIKESDNAEVHTDLAEIGYVPTPIIRDDTSDSWTLGVLTDTVRAPKSFKYHVFDGKGRVVCWGIDGELDIAVFSEVDNPESFPTDNYHRFGSEVIACVQAPEVATLQTNFNVFVFTANSIWGMDTSQESVRVTQLTGTMGALSRRAVMTHGEFVYFVASDGVYRMAGLQIERISSDDGNGRGGIQSMFTGHRATPYGTLKTASISHNNADNTLYISLKLADTGVCGVQFGKNIAMIWDLDRPGWHIDQRLGEGYNIAFDKLIADAAGGVWGWLSVDVADAINGDYNLGAVAKLDYGYKDFNSMASLTFDVYGVEDSETMFTYQQSIGGMLGTSYELFWNILETFRKLRYYMNDINEEYKNSDVINAISVIDDYIDASDALDPSLTDAWHTVEFGDNLATEAGYSYFCSLAPWLLATTNSLNSYKKLLEQAATDILSGLPSVPYWGYYYYGYGYLTWTCDNNAVADCAYWTTNLCAQIDDLIDALALARTNALAHCSRLTTWRSNLQLDNGVYVWDCATGRHRAATQTDLDGKTWNYFTMKTSATRYAPGWDGYTYAAYRVIPDFDDGEPNRYKIWRRINIHSELCPAGVTIYLSRDHSPLLAEPLDIKLSNRDVPEAVIDDTTSHTIDRHFNFFWFGETVSQLGGTNTLSRLRRGIPTNTKSRALRISVAARTKLEAVDTANQITDAWPLIVNELELEFTPDNART